MRQSLDALLELRRNGVVFDDRFTAEAKPNEVLNLAADLEARAAMLRGQATEREALRLA